MSSPNVLSYNSPRSGSEANSAEFRAAYDRERGRWLRRRILWYLAICAGLALITLLFTLRGGAADPSLKSHAWLDVVMNVNLIVSVFIYAAAMVWAWRAQPRYALLLRAAVWFYLLTSLWGVALNYYSHGVMSFESAGTFAEGVERGFSEVRNERDRQRAATRAATQPTTQITSSSSTSPAASASATAPATQAGAFVVNGKPRPTMPALVVDLWGFLFVWFMIAFTLAFNHLLTCLFLPWTVRESIRPASLIILFAVLLLAFDLIARPTLPARSIFFIVTAVTCCAAFLPGTGICWWRFSRFNKHFRLQYESQGFRKLQGELEGARRIHEAVLPPRRTSGPVRVDYCYEPAQQIGGDMVVVHPHDARNAAATTLVALDVTGHGIAAALTLNRVMGEIERSFADDPDASPLTLTKNLNRYVHATASKHSVFMTALAVRIPHDAVRPIEFVNAGHPTGFVVRSDSARTIEPLESTAMLLGCATGEDFICEGGEPVELKPGDAVVLYTDGWSEAANPRGKQLGTAGVREMIERVARSSVPVEQWCEAFISQIRAYRESEPQDDTLIVVAWRG